MKKSIVFVLQIYLVSFLTEIAFGQYSTVPATLANCAKKEKCDDCIRSYGCGWCSDPDFKNPRCYRTGDAAGCVSRFAINPKIEAQIVTASPLTDVVKGVPSEGGSSSSGVGVSSQDVIQVTPQKMVVKLRRNEGNPYRFKMWYKRALDYPVDFYYLMDLSHSMKDDKDILSALGDQLAREMRKLTSNFRLGFGSFVDKVVMPYVSIVPQSLKEPCVGCAAPYGFKNIMSLSQDTTQFSRLVAEAPISGNLDAPEGGFDGLMQAIVCTDQIGWRNNSRRLVLFSTDSSFHFAGDGKLGGIVKPNDGRCHLDQNGEYTYSNIQDYPSVSQLNAKAKEHAINIIFAVTEDQIPLYKELQKHIEGSSSGHLSQDSSNIVDLVVKEYSELASKVEMKERDKPSFLNVRYYTRCLNESGPLSQTNQCTGLTVGKQIEFEVELEMTDCPQNQSSSRQVFTIYPVGFSEGLQIEVQTMCDCDCQFPGHRSYLEHSPKCSGHGTLKCGICECDFGFSGNDCGCTSDGDLTDQCHPINNSTQLCSGNGTCKCNKCECPIYPNNEKYYGQYCECNNFQCPRDDKGSLCSEHGKCDCGKCTCDLGWSGDACQKAH